MAIILPDLPCIRRFGTIHRCRNNALAPWQTPSNLCQQCQCSSWKHPEIGEDLEALLADVESIPADIRQALINNGGGHLNHALFWELMTPEKTAPSAELAAAIDATFGSFEEFKQPSQQQQQLVLVLAGHGWLSTKKVNLKWLQQQTKTHQSQKVKTNLGLGRLGTCLTTWNTATCVLTTSKLSSQWSTGTK